VIAATLAEAEETLADLFGGGFGGAGAQVVIEEFMEGEEASFFALTDGTAIVPFGSAQDHKRVGDGDTGPNTGGMGAYSPAPVLTPELQARVMAEIIEPTVRTMREEGNPYQGVLFAGLMITGEGPKLIEFNVRFGDPECQVLMLRLEDDLVELLLACAQGSLATIPPPRLSPDSRPGRTGPAQACAAARAAGRTRRIPRFAFAGGERCSPKPRLRRPEPRLRLRLALRRHRRILRSHRLAVSRCRIRQCRVGGRCCLHN
jgi:hypothetical protein